MPEILNQPKRTVKRWIWDEQIDYDNWLLDVMTIWPEVGLEHSFDGSYWGDSVNAAVIKTNSYPVTVGMWNADDAYPADYKDMKVRCWIHISPCQKL